MRGLLLTLLLLLAGPALATQPNIILVVLDDVTACWIGKYSTDLAECSEAFLTPAIDTLAAGGVTVATAWATPLCSPFRASMLTGTLPRQHGVGRASAPVNSLGYFGLQAAQQNLARTLSAAGYRTEIYGKWHLSNDEMGSTAQKIHPSSVGFQTGSGTAAQTGSDICKPALGATGYENWEDINFVTGECALNTTYATTEIIDDAIAALSGSEPFFLYLPMQAPHAPIHTPPAGLHTATTECDDPDTGPANLREVCFNRAIQAADTEIGRLVAHGDYDATNTIIIITADNGTPDTSSNRIASLTNASWQLDRCKGTVTQCGLWVPMIVSGVGVAVNDTADILVQATDLHATILEMAQVENVAAGWTTGSMMPSLGGQQYVYRGESFYENLVDPTLPSKRACIYSEQFEPDLTTGERIEWHEAIRNSTHHLIFNNDDGETYPEELFLNTSIYQVAPTDHQTLSGDVYDDLVAKRNAMNDRGIGDPCR